MTATETPTAFQQELSELLNTHSLEGQSDTPDYILAAFLTECLEAWNNAATARTQFFRGEVDHA